MVAAVARLLITSAPLVTSSLTSPPLSNVHSDSRSRLSEVRDAITARPAFGPNVAPMVSAMVTPPALTPAPAPDTPAGPVPGADAIAPDTSLSGTADLPGSNEATLGGLAPNGTITGS